MYNQKYFLPEYENGAPSGGWYDIGCDIGINNDNTVIVVMDRNIRQQVFFWRFCPGSSKNWHMNYDALQWTYEYWGMPLRVDCGGSGSSLPSEMPRRGVPLVQWGGGADGMKFTEFNKPVILDNLSSLIGGGHIKLFNLPEIKSELSKMQRNPKTSGRGFSIEAPKGRNEHDDIPIALGLACMHITPVLKTISESRSVSTGPRSIFMTEEW